MAWKALRHPNILPLLGVVMSGTQFAMVSRWMSNGNINQFVKAHQDVNRFELVSSWFKLPLLYPLLPIGWFSQLVDVAEGLVFMHGQGMVHGDLKGVCSLLSVL